jgi:hypothetical protein
MSDNLERPQASDEGIGLTQPEFEKSETAFADHRSAWGSSLRRQLPYIPVLGLAIVGVAFRVRRRGRLIVQVDRRSRHRLNCRFCHISGHACCPFDPGARHLVPNLGSVYGSCQANDVASKAPACPRDLKRPAGDCRANSAAFPQDPAARPAIVTTSCVWCTAPRPGPESAQPGATAAVDTPGGDNSDAG